MAEHPRPSAVRSRAEDFLELVERSKHGRLKLYLGFAAGVGKTYRMVEEATALKKRGVDVVLAFIESHGRSETEALVQVSGVERIQRRVETYRGVSVEDMDLNAVLARRPQVAVVDELAHTNVPGSRHPKRYQDVLELLDAGINVIGAFNIQHLDSLNALVQRATGVSVRETIPDGFLAQADQVVNLDLAVEDLHERLRSGKIYASDKIEWALQGFFKPENLATLRELSLREVAETLDRRSIALSPSAQLSLPGGSGKGRVMVCLSSAPPRALTLLQTGSRMAGRLNTDWFVVYVETPSEAPDRIESEAQRHLLSNIDKARELGAEVVRLRSKDAVAALLDFARSHGVGHIIVGRSTQPAWQRWLKPSIVQQLVNEAAGFDLHIVSFRGEGEA
jgi:two-component system sensor histidine kinase KdpD